MSYEIRDATYGMKHEGWEMTDARWICAMRKKRTSISHHGSLISHLPSIIFPLSFPASDGSRFQGVGDTRGKEAGWEVMDERGEMRDARCEMRDARCEMRDGG